MLCYESGVHIITITTFIFIIAETSRRPRNNEQFLYSEPERPVAKSLDVSHDKSRDPMYETLDNSKAVMMEYCPAYQPLPPGRTNASVNVTNPLYNTVPPLDTPPTDTPTPTDVPTDVPLSVYTNTAGDDASANIP